MGTFLTNSKMNPALRERIEASVRAGSPRVPGAAPSRLRPRVVAVVRVAAAAGLIAAVVSVLVMWRRTTREFEQSRAALLMDVRARAAAFTAPQRRMVEQIEGLLLDADDPSAPDYIAPALTKPRALQALLDRPSVYLRGPSAAFGNVSALRALSAEASQDAFIHCLIRPPSARNEKAVLAAVRAAYDGDVASEAVQVGQLHAARMALPFISQPWLERVETVTSSAELKHMRRQFERAPLQKALRVARALHVVAVLDEPKAAGAVVEIDGATAHRVQVVLYEIASGKQLLRLRRSVDPAWVSEKHRSAAARDLNSCRLALDVRAHAENPE